MPLEVSHLYLIELSDHFFVKKFKIEVSTS